MHSYTAHFHIRLYELNAENHVPSAALLRLIEQTAIEASRDAGFPMAWYDTRGEFWVIRKMLFEYLRPARVDDELTITTWVSEMSRVRAWRDMLVKRGDEVIARARGDWVYLNRAKLAPARIAPEIVDYFNRSGPPVLVESKRDYPLKGRQGREFAQTRRVQRYEMDSVAHVNNAVYLNWLEEAVADALERAGYHLLPGVEEKRPTLWFQRHTLEYLRPAFAGDEIEVKTALVGAGLSVGMWEQTIERGGELLVRNLARTRWVDADGRHARWQDTLVDALAL